MQQGEHLGARPFVRGRATDPGLAFFEGHPARRFEQLVDAAPVVTIHGDLGGQSAR
jgi:hypothetical protein